VGNKKVDPGDTIDHVTHYLHKLQAEGWTLQGLSHDLDYGESKSGSKLLISSTLKIKLIPRA
jgi:hypothetical protein